MVSYFVSLYFVLYLAVRPVGQNHERRPGGQSHEESLGGDEEYEGRDGGRSQEEDEGVSQTGQGQNPQQRLRQRHQGRCPRSLNAQFNERMS